jgi:hypothetical protein
MRLGHGPRVVRSGRSVLLSTALALALVTVYRAPDRIGSSAREAPLARVAIDVARPGTLIFAAALWGLDALFTLAHAGLVQVNFHIYDLERSPGYYNPIVSTATRSTRGTWTYTTRVRPLYYAMLLFRNAVGRRFLPATISATRANVKAYAVGDGATVRVFALNKDLRASGPVVIAPSRALGLATVAVLRAPSPSATTETTLGGQAIDPLTGFLPPPHTRTVVPDATAGTYTVNVPDASAVMVTLQSAGTGPHEANPPRTDGAGKARAARCAQTSSWST